MRGWNRHRIRVSTQSWLRRRKFSRRSCRDSNSQPFDHESGALPTSYPANNKLVIANNKFGNCILSSGPPHRVTSRHEEEEQEKCANKLNGNLSGDGYNSFTKSIQKELVSWCFQPSQPQKIISGLRKTFIKRYIVERTNKAEIRQEEQNEKRRRVVGRIYGMKYSSRAMKTETDTRTE